MQTITVDLVSLRHELERAARVRFFVKPNRFPADGRHCVFEGLGTDPPRAAMLCKRDTLEEAELACHKVREDYVEGKLAAMERTTG